MITLSKYKKNTFWKYTCNNSIKRLNIIDMSPVNIDFFNNMLCIGMINYTKLQNVMFSESEWMTMNKIFNNIKISNNVFLFKVNIKQYLQKKLHNHSAYHNEVWIFGLFHDQTNNKYYLSPLKRDSDFGKDDIISILENLCHINCNMPWKRHSCYVEKYYNEQEIIKSNIAHI